jgi:hypothetical protein
MWTLCVTSVQRLCVTCDRRPADALLHLSRVVVLCVVLHDVPDSIYLLGVEWNLRLIRVEDSRHVG